MNVAEIEGVGPAYAAKLADAGAPSAEKLLELGGTASGRLDLAAKSGIPDSLILKWVNHADLMRISGVGPQYAELLESAGVDSVAELANRNGANLTKKMADVNEAKNLTNRAPSESEVAGWIDQAGKLPRAVSH